MKARCLTTLALAFGLVVTGALAATQAAAQTDGSAPAAAQIVLTSHLPDSAELTRDAAAQGLTVKSQARTASELSVTYTSADGKSRSAIYRLNAVAATKKPRPAITLDVDFDFDFGRGNSR